MARASSARRTGGPLRRRFQALHDLRRDLVRRQQQVGIVRRGVLYLEDVEIGVVARRSIGFIAKLTYEALEEIDPTQVEAIAATGAGGIGLQLDASIATLA